MRISMDLPVVTALIASFTSVLVATLSAAFAYRTQVSMLKAKAARDEELEKLRTSLAEAKSERDARRDYRYDAMRRLYEVAEPLFFQLAERAEELYSRITGLARTASNGDLEPPRGWLSGDGYYMRSMIHRLLSPVGVFHLLQDGLTLVDLSLDRGTRLQYAMSRHLAWALTDPFSFARLHPQIPYDPYGESEGRISSEIQGLPSGIVETAGQSLIVHAENGTARIMRFGEFDDAYSNKDSAVHRACAPMSRLLFNFHPQTHPVLWRVLVTQASLCAAFTRTRDGVNNPGDVDGRSMVMPWMAIPQEERALYDWRQSRDQATDQAVLIEPFAVAETYLKSRIGQ
jgi:hypothetical protein